jgi:hypothetical protein
MVSESLELGLMEFTQRATLDGGSGLFLAEQPLVVTDEGLKVAGAVDAADLAHLDIQPPLDAALSPRQWNSLLIDTLPRMSAA